jgi:hypothetical protein
MPSDWERLSDDAALLAEVRRRYRGRGDPADQLWWTSHPGEDGPSGAPDPMIGLDADRVDLYRRGATGEQVDALTDQRVLLDEDRRLAQEALQEAIAARGPARPGTRPIGGSARAGSGAARTVVTLLAGMSLLAAGFVLGRSAGASAPQPTPTARAYRVLERPQETPDRIPATVRPRFVRASSTRLLATYGSIGTEVYGARADDGRLCLLVVVLGAKPTGTCTTESGFTTAGLFVAFTAGADPVNDSGLRPSDQIGLLWMADGTLTISV